jgi:hypothetical protein
MDFWKQLVPSGQQKDPQRSSLTAEWNQYASDVEAGGSSGEESQLFGGKAAVSSAASTAATSVSAFLTTAYSRVQDGATNLSTMQAPVR